MPASYVRLSVIPDMMALTESGLIAGALHNAENYCADCRGCNCCLRGGLRADGLGAPRQEKEVISISTGSGILIHLDVRGRRCLRSVRATAS